MPTRAQRTLQVLEEIHMEVRGLLMDPAECSSSEKLERASREVHRLFSEAIKTQQKAKAA